VAYFSVFQKRSNFPLTTPSTPSYDNLAINYIHDGIIYNANLSAQHCHLFEHQTRKN